MNMFVAKIASLALAQVTSAPAPPPSAFRPEPAVISTPGNPGQPHPARSNSTPSPAAFPTDRYASPYATPQNSDAAVQPSAPRSTSVQDRIPQRDPAEYARAAAAVAMTDEAREGGGTLAQFCTISLQELPESLRGNARRVTLLEFLASGQVSQPRLQVIAGYWELAEAIGKYRFAVEEERFLSQLNPGNDELSAALIDSELASVQAERQQAELDLLRRQEEIRGAATRPWDSVWPADAPWVGQYRTRLVELFGENGAPSRLRQIDRALPLLRQQIELRERAATAAHNAVTALGRSPTTAEQLLDAHRRLRMERRLFLAAVKEYNQRIAEYALSVTGPSTSADTLVSTLIKPNSRLTPLQDPGVRAASADVPLSRFEFRDPSRGGGSPAARPPSLRR